MENKNHLYRIEGGELLACNPDIETFMKGFDGLASLLPRINDQLKDWMQSPLMSRLVVRYLPCATQSFKYNLELAKHDRFSRVKLVRNQASQILYLLYRHLVVNGEADINDVLKVCYIFLDEGLNDSLLHFNIPVYYSAVTSQALMNDQGAHILIDIQKLKDFLLDYIQQLEDGLFVSEEVLAYGRAVRPHLLAMSNAESHEHFFPACFLESSLERLRSLVEDPCY